MQLSYRFFREFRIFVYIVSVYCVKEMATDRNGRKEAKSTMDLSSHHAIMTILNEGI